MLLLPFNTKVFGVLLRPLDSISLACVAIGIAPGATCLQNGVQVAGVGKGACGLAVRAGLVPLHTGLSIDMQGASKACRALS